LEGSLTVLKVLLVFVDHVEIRVAASEAEGEGLDILEKI
jgi:hypothetical protein